MAKKDRVFPEITSSPWFVITYSVLMFAVLWYLSSGRSEAANPIYMYLILGSWLVILGANSANFKELKKLAGFKAPYPGYNAMLAIFGIGLGGLVFTLFVYNAQVIFQGNEYAMSLIQPFYLPLSLPQYSVTLGLAGAGTYIFYGFVGVFEELQKIFHWKSICNYITSKGVKLEYAAFIAFIIANLIWFGLHFFSWGGLTLGSMLFALFFGTVFWASYLIPDIAGLLSPDKPIEWSGVLLSGAVTSHATYDVLVTEGIPLPYNQFLIISITLVVVPLVGMWLIRRAFESGIDLVPIEDQR